MVGVRAKLDDSARAWEGNRAHSVHVSLSMLPNALMMLVRCKLTALRLPCTALPRKHTSRK